MLQHKDPFATIQIIYTTTKFMMLLVEPVLVVLKDAEKDCNSFQTLPRFFTDFLDPLKRDWKF